MNSSLDLIAGRHCKRAYLKRPVRPEILMGVFEAAANAPSSQNNQPWEVAVLSGSARDDLSAKLCRNFDEGLVPNADYVNRPKDLPARLAARTSGYGQAMLEHKGIDRNDAAARKAHQRENYLFYGAPIELIFHLPANSVAGTFLDLGMFMQNVMLGLRIHGLSSCPQFSVAAYSDTVRKHLSLGEDRIIVSGMAVGYADDAAPINGFCPVRATVDEFVRWFDRPSLCDVNG